MCLILVNPIFGAGMSECEVFVSVCSGFLSDSETAELVCDYNFPSLTFMYCL